MKRKLIALTMTGGLVLGGANVALAGHGGDGHKPQDRGLCTAFFNGNKNGWEKNGYPPPFEDLISRAESNTHGEDGTPGNADDPTGADAVAEFCGSLVGGNPGPNGKSEGKGKGGN